jgi:hypothetical protein
MCLDDGPVQDEDDWRQHRRASTRRLLVFIGILVAGFLGLIASMHFP